MCVEPLTVCEGNRKEEPRASACVHDRLACVRACVPAVANRHNRTRTSAGNRQTNKRANINRTHVGNGYLATSSQLPHNRTDSVRHSHTTADAKWPAQ